MISFFINNSRLLCSIRSVLTQLCISVCECGCMVSQSIGESTMNFITDHMNKHTRHSLLVAGCLVTGLDHARNFHIVYIVIIFFFFIQLHVNFEMCPAFSQLSRESLCLPMLI